MTSALRVLLLEDNELDVGLIERELKKAGILFSLKVVCARDEFLTALRNGGIDVILADYSLPQFNGMMALQSARKVLPHVPFIMVTGSISEETAVECMKAGAADYVLKERLFRLAPAVQSVLERQAIWLEKQRAETDLRESEARFRRMADAAPVLIWMSGTDAKCNYFNQPWLNFTGRSLAEEMGDGWIESVHADDRQHCGDSYLAAFAARQRFELEYRLRRYDGEYRWILDLGVPLFTDNGTFAGYIGSCMDITERKQAGEMRHRLAAIVEGSSDAIIGKGLDSVVTSWNSGAERIFGYAAAEIIGRPIHMLIPGESHHEEQEIISKIRRGEHLSHYETVRVCKDGQRITVSLTVSPVRDASGKITGVSTIARDITDRKVAEAKLKASLREKEVLLKEVHHRVKNNMQLIYSLFNLQSRQSKNPEVRALLQENQDRVHSLALIHESLYQTRNLSNIDFGAYIKLLGTNLVRSLGSRTSTRLNFNLEPIYLGVDTAIPCGLIVNELLSNALKHAFPGEGPAMITIGLARLPEGRIRLSVADSGIGVPDEFDWHSSANFGLQLVGTLAEQLRGVVNISNKNGTEIAITFVEQNITPL